MREGARYSGEDLEGAVIDADYALEIAGLTVAEVMRTDESFPMVTYRCRPRSTPADPAKVLDRLEEEWIRVGAFKHEAHSVAVDANVVSLDFVTWWDRGTFYTGRIEVSLEGAP